MTSFENLRDEEVIERTLIKPDLTGGYEDPGFKDSELDSVLNVNRPPEGEEAEAQAPASAQEAQSEEPEYKKAA